MTHSGAKLTAFKYNYSAHTCQMLLPLGILHLDRRTNFQVVVALAERLLGRESEARLAACGRTLARHLAFLEVGSVSCIMGGWLSCSWGFVESSGHCNGRSSHVFCGARKRFCWCCLSSLLQMPRWKGICMCWHLNLECVQAKRFPHCWVMVVQEVQCTYFSPRLDILPNYISSAF